MSSRDAKNIRKEIESILNIELTDKQKIKLQILLDKSIAPDHTRYKNLKRDFTLLKNKYIDLQMKKEILKNEFKK